MKVFLSSTYLDLIEHRKASAEALTRLGYHVIGMETFNARTEDPTITSLKEVDECELFVGIYAYRYGSTIKDIGASVTEQEFDYAVKMEKAIFAFFLSDINTLPPESIDKDSEQIEKLNDFKTKIVNHVTPDYFTDKTDLAYKIVSAVKSHIARSKRLRFFVNLDEYLMRPTTGFPKQDDFDKGLVYFPQGYLEEIQKVIDEQNKCLLIGNSSAGKTVLAIAFAKALRSKNNFHIQYGDASRALEGDGRLWYSHILENDRKDFIFVIDNCHLAIDEVNDCCFQIDGDPPKFAKLILIARPKTKGNVDTLTVIGDFYDLWKECSVYVKPERLYKGILKHYEKYYFSINPTYYIPLDDDEDSILERQHSFSLVASKSRLTAWLKVGGKLSDVTKELVYKSLAEKYLSKSGSTLSALCCLWQVELPIHISYIEDSLPNEDIDYLLSANILTYDIIPNYGKMFYLFIHPDEAKEIFETNIFLRQGSLTQEAVLNEIVTHFTRYLSTEPQNFQAVYDNLYQHGYKDIEQTLLQNTNLQHAAENRFRSGRLTDIFRYLFSVSKIQPETSRKMLRKIIGDTGLSKIRTNLEAQNIHNMQFALFYCHRVDRELASQLALELTNNIVSLKIQKDNFYNLGWFIKSLGKISSKKTREILDAVPLDILANIASKGTIKEVERFLSHCRRFKIWGKEEITQFVEQLIQNPPSPTISELDSLSAIQSVLNELNKHSSSLATKYRKYITKNMPPNDLAKVMNNSPLHRVASTVCKGNPFWKPGFSLFLEKYFINKLTNCRWSEIGKFLSYFKNPTNPFFNDVTNKLRGFISTENFQKNIHDGNLSEIASYLEVVTICGDIDTSILKGQCQAINAQERSSEIVNTPFEVITPFLWNLTNIGDLDNLNIADQPVFKDRLRSYWESHIIWALELLGICLLTKPNYQTTLQNLQVSDKQKSDLARWAVYAVNHKLLFPFLLVFKGLRTIDFETANKVVSSINTPETNEWIDSSLDRVATRHTRELIQETRRWLGELYFQDTINTIDKVINIINRHRFSNNK